MVSSFLLFVLVASEDTGLHEGISVWKILWMIYLFNGKSERNLTAA
jgi:hypothetical protein